MGRRRLVLVFLLLFAGGFATVRSEDQVLRVAVHEKPPYATLEDGQWTGLSVDLWRRVATLAGLRFELIDVPYDEVLPGIASGRFDAGIGEFDVTAKWESRLDFSQPFLHSAVGVAVREGAYRLDWRAIIAEFFNWTLLKVLLWILVSMFVVSLIIWALERHHQVGHFKGGLHGFGSALWFAAVTMTTVGYGDKTPATFAGRFVAFCWMLIGVLLVAGFTGAVASSVAAARVESIARRGEDLRQLRCGSMEGSRAQEILKAQGFPVKTFETVQQAMDALSAGPLDAIVADRLTLAYLIRTSFREPGKAPVALASFTFGEATIAMPMQTGFPHAEAINVAILQTLESAEWQAIRTRWLGTAAQE